MQEEVENRTVNLAVSTTKLTARTLIRAFRWYLMHRGQKRLRKQMQHPHEEGKQSVNDLLKSGVSTDKIELPDGSAKDFCKVAKKFGVDYAIRKDKTQDPPRYIVFFKAKDTEVLDQVVKEYISVTDKKNEKASLREQLKQEKAAAKAEAKEKAKTQKKQKRKRKYQFSDINLVEFCKLQNVIYRYRCLIGFDRLKFSSAYLHRLGNFFL